MKLHRSYKVILHPYGSARCNIKFIIFWLTHRYFFLFYMNGPVWSDANEPNAYSFTK